MPTNAQRCHAVRAQLLLFVGTFACRALPTQLLSCTCLLRPCRWRRQQQQQQQQQQQRMDVALGQGGGAAPGWFQAARLLLVSLSCCEQQCVARSFGVCCSIPLLPQLS